MILIQECKKYWEIIYTDTGSSTDTTSNIYSIKRLSAYTFLVFLKLTWNEVEIILMQHFCKETNIRTCMFSAKI